MSLRRFTLMHQVPSGLSSTVRIPMADWEIIEPMIPDIILIALVSYLETISVAKAFARKGTLPLEYELSYQTTIK